MNERALDKVKCSVSGIARSTTKDENSRGKKASALGTGCIDVRLIIVECERSVRSKARSHLGHIQHQRHNRLPNGVTRQLHRGDRTSPLFV